MYNCIGVKKHGKFPSGVRPGEDLFWSTLDGPMAIGLVQGGPGGPGGFRQMEPYENFRPPFLGESPFFCFLNSNKNNMDCMDGPDQPNNHGLIFRPGSVQGRYTPWTNSMKTAISRPPALRTVTESNNDGHFCGVVGVLTTVTDDRCSMNVGMYKLHGKHNFAYHVGVTVLQLVVRLMA